MIIDEKILDFDNLSDSEKEEIIKELIEKKKNGKKEKHEIKKYITAKEVGTIVGLSDNTVYKHARDGKIKSVKIGGSVRFDKDDLFNFVSSMRFESKYESEAFCKKNCILSANGDLMVFKVFSIYKIMRENKIWIYLYNSQFEHSIRIGKKEFRKYFSIATEIEIDAAKYNLGPNFG